MKLSLLPAALISCSIDECHLSLPTSLIMMPLALVAIAIPIDFATKAVFDHLPGKDSTICLDRNDIHVAEGDLPRSRLL